MEWNVFTDDQINWKLILTNEWNSLILDAAWYCDCVYKIARTIPFLPGGDDAVIKREIWVSGDSSSQLNQNNLANRSQ